MIEHNRMVAITVGSEPPVTVVLYFEPEADDPARLETDSGFSVLFSDAPETWRGTPEQKAQLQTVCLHCLIDAHPEVGRGLDLARKYGSAERYPDPLTGEWVGRDPETGDWFEEES